MQSVPEIDCFLFGCERWKETVVTYVQKMKIIAMYRLEILNWIVVMRWRPSKSE